MAHKFPNPADRSEAQPAVLCKSDRVKALYNKAHGTSVKRVGKTVSEWFLQRAEEEGWDSAIFIKEVQSNHSAGCILFKSQNKTVQINLFLTGITD